MCRTIPELDSGMKNVSPFPAVAPSLRLMLGCPCSCSGKKPSGHRACGATLRMNIKFLCASLKYSWRSEWGCSCMTGDRYCNLYASAFSHRLFFPFRLMVSEERSLDLFLTVQQECCIPFQAFLCHHSVYNAAFGRDFSCTCPNPRGTYKKGTKPEEHWVPVLPLWVRKVEKTFLNAGLFIRFLLFPILWTCVGASWANAAEGSDFPACAICHTLEISCSILGRLEITALLVCLLQNVLRVTPCKVRGMDKHKEGGAVGMFHVIVNFWENVFGV